MGGFGFSGFGKERFNGFFLLGFEIFALAVDLFDLVAVECIDFLETILSALCSHFFLGTLRFAHD